MSRPTARHFADTHCTTEALPESPNQVVGVPASFFCKMILDTLELALGTA